MTSDAMPDVEKQVSYYKNLMDRCGDKKVIFRSLDVGSDKLLPYWAYAGEANPAIGWGSIRITHCSEPAVPRKSDPAQTDPRLFAFGGGQGTERDVSDDFRSGGI